MAPEPKSATGGGPAGPNTPAARTDAAGPDPLQTEKRYGIVASARPAIAPAGTPSKPAAATLFSSPSNSRGQLPTFFPFMLRRNIEAVECHELSKSASKKGSGIVFGENTVYISLARSFPRPDCVIPRFVPAPLRQYAQKRLNGTRPAWDAITGKRKEIDGHEQDFGRTTARAGIP